MMMCKMAFIASTKNYDSGRVHFYGPSVHKPTTLTSDLNCTVFINYKLILLKYSINSSQFIGLKIIRQVVFQNRIISSYITHSYLNICFPVQELLLY